MKRNSKDIKEKETKEQQNLKNRIKFLSSKRQFEEALNLINQYLKEYSDDYYMVAYKITLLFKNEKKEEALELANTTLDLSYLDNQSKEFIYEALAIAATSDDDYMAAIDYWSKCVELMEPRVYSKGICNIALLYNLMGEEEKGLELVEPRENFNPEIFNVTRARILYENGKYTQAVSELERETTKTTRESAQTKAEAQKYNLRGLICDKLAEKKTGEERINLQREALDWYKKVRQTISDEHMIYWDSLLHTALVNYSFGNDTEAIRICNKVLEKCTNERVIDSTISLLASDHIKNFGFDEAEKEYDKHPNELRKIIGYAKVSLARYDFNNAYKLLDSVKTLDEEIMFTKNCLMAQVMLRKNDYREFLKYYQLAIFSNKADKNAAAISDLNKMLMMLEVANDLPITRSPRTYYEKQIASYHEQAAIDNTTYIRDNMIEKETFSTNTDIRKLYSDVKDYLDPSRKLCDGIYDKYVVDMSQMGEIKDNLRFITVACLANTHKIIKIYPSNHYVGIFVSKKEKPVQKTKLSAIDKFNKKYGL